MCLVSVCIDQSWGTGTDDQEGEDSLIGTPRGSGEGLSAGRKSRSLPMRVQVVPPWSQEERQ